MSATTPNNQSTYFGHPSGGSQSAGYLINRISSYYDGDQYRLARPWAMYDQGSKQWDNAKYVDLLATDTETDSTLSNFQWHGIQTKEFTVNGTLSWHLNIQAGTSNVQNTMLGGDTSYDTHTPGTHFDSTYSKSAFESDLRTLWSVITPGDAAQLNSAVVTYILDNPSANISIQPEIARCLSPQIVANLGDGNFTKILQILDVEIAGPCTLHRRSWAWAWYATRNAPTSFSPNVAQIFAALPDRLVEVYVRWADDLYGNQETKKIDPVAMRYLSVSGQLYICTHYADRLTTTLIAMISNAAISQLSGGWFTRLSLDLLHSLTPGQVASVSPAQIAALGATLANFTPEQMALMTGTQVQAITRTQWAIITPQQFNRLLGAIGGEEMDLSRLTGDQIAALPLASIEALQPRTLATLSAAQVATLSVEQLLVLSADQLTALRGKEHDFKAEAVACFSREQVAALGSAPNFPAGAVPVVNMTAQQIAALSTTTLQQLAGSTFASLSDAQLSGLTRSQTLNLLPNQYTSLSDAQKRLLPSTPVLSMPVGDIPNLLSTRDIAGLSALVIGALPAAALRNFTRNQIQALSSAQIRSLSVEVLNVVGDAFFKNLTPTQWAAFSDTTLRGLTPSLATEILGRYANFLSTSEVASLNGATHATFGNPAIPSSVRNVYTLANQVRTLTALTGSLAKHNLSSIAAIRSYFEKYQQKVDSSRASQQGMRLVGSALALSAVANAFYQASRDDNAMQYGKDVLQGLAWAASALQIPVSIIIAAYDAYLKGESPSDTFYEKIGLGDYLKNLKNNNKSYWELTFKGPVRTWEPIKVFSNPGAVHSPIDDCFRDRLSRLPFNSDASRQALRRNAAALVANALGVINSALDIAKAVEQKSDIDTVAAVLNTLISGVAFAGDAIDAIFKANSASTKLASRLLGASVIASVLISDVIGLLKDAQAYQKDPSASNLTALVGSAIGDAVQLGLILAGMFAGGLPGVLLTLAAALVPNFDAVGSALKIVEQWQDLNRQGRTVEGDTICYYLHEIAALNATPLVNLTSSIYTPIIMGQLYSAMQSQLLLALQQDLQYFLANDTSRNIAKIQGQILSTRNTENEICGVLSISALTVDEKDYYASASRKISNYLSVVDVGTSTYSANTQSLVRANSNGTYANLTYTLTSSASGTKLVQLANDTASKMIVDASASSQKMIFTITGRKIDITGGSSKNGYYVDSSVQNSVWVHGGTSGEDYVQIVQHDASTSSSTILLDNISNASVSAAGGFTYNTVSGTVSKQKYIYGGGADTVKMTGGKSFVELGGRGNSLIMAGGNNLAYVVLGYSRYAATLSTSSQGVYDGGSTVAASTDGAYSGLNTISFAGSAGRLSFDITDPKGAFSTVATSSGNYADSGKFRNFQNIFGSNLGDHFNIYNSSNLNQLVLGLGNNDVRVRNTAGMIVQCGAESDKLWIEDNSDITVNTLAGCESDIQITGNSSVSGYLGGTADSVDASNDGPGTGTKKTLMNFMVGSGTHKIRVGGEKAEIDQDALTDGSLTEIYGAASTTTLMTTAQQMNNELVQTDGHTIRFLSINGRTQELDYVFGAGDTGHNAFVQSAKSGSIVPVIVAIDLLVSAMASGAVAQTTGNFGGSTQRGYSFQDLTQYVQNHYSAVTL